MQRRLNLAVALIHEPSIVLLDEPTVGVDPQSRNHLFQCIEQLQDSGLTIIYTTQLHGRSPAAVRPRRYCR